MSKDEFIYAMWAVMAVQGLMGEADQFLRQHREIVYRISRKLSKKLPPKLPTLYRGILLSPKQIKGNLIVEKYPVEFISFSELKEVACWFASPDSYMSSYVLKARPDSLGFIVEYKALASNVLFHWRWHEALKIERVLGEIDRNLMLNRINTDIRQYLHNIKTQREVILKPTEQEFELIEKDLVCTMTGPELDKKYLPSWVERI